MSTRCNVIIKDSHDELFFYRHSDGYPEVTGESLKGFVSGYKSQFRNNVNQSAGWLIVYGHKEYGSETTGWKVGAYEPTTGLHGDIEYIYVIDLKQMTLKTIKGQDLLEGELLEIFDIKQGKII